MSVNSTNVEQLLKGAKGAHLDPKDEQSKETLKGLNEILSKNSLKPNPKIKIQEMQEKEEQENKELLEDMQKLGCFKSESQKLESIRATLSTSKIWVDQTDNLFSENTKSFSASVLFSYDDRTKMLIHSRGEVTPAAEVIYAEENKCIEAFFDFISLNKTLTTLTIQYSELSVEHLERLFGALKINQTVTALNLKSIKVRDTSAHSLSEMLKCNQSIIFLNLSSNHICEEGAGELAEALEKNKTLTILDLAHNHCKNGAAAIARALEKNQTLFSLNLEGNNIGSTGFQAIQKMLPENKSLIAFKFMPQVSLEWSHLTMVSHIKNFDKIIKRNQIFQSAHANWSRISLLLAFIRAHADNALRFSIMALIPTILRFDTTCGLNPKTLEPVSVIETENGKHPIDEIGDNLSWGDFSASMQDLEPQEPEKTYQLPLINLNAFMDTGFFQRHINPNFSYKKEKKSEKSGGWDVFGEWIEECDAKEAKKGSQKSY